MFPFLNRLFSFLSFSDLFPAFNWAKITGSLLNLWFGVSIFNPTPFWFLIYSADSSLPNSGMSVVSCCSSVSLGFRISFNNDKISTLFFLISCDHWALYYYFYIISNIVVLFFKPTSIHWATSFSKLSALSSVISLSSAVVFNPSFLALVIVLSIWLNLSLLTSTQFGSFN